MKPILPSPRPLCATALLLLASGQAAADTGARVLLQAWNPAQPDTPNVQTLVDQPRLVSDTLRDAWTRARPAMCDQLRATLGKRGLVGGQSLYDITCLLDETPQFEVSAAQQNALTASIRAGIYLEATSTVPDPFGSEFDPRISVASTARLDLTLQVQADRAHTLRVSQARFSVSGTTLDSHNAAADIAAFVASDLSGFFLGVDFKRLAEDTINAQSIDLARNFDDALAPVNAVLSGPSDYVRVGVSGSGNYVTVAFAPREFPPVTTGSMRGVVRWDPTQFTPSNGCQSFDIQATVQTGPVPLLTPNAEAPMRRVGQFHAVPAGDAACQFTLDGLAVGWPNLLSPRISGAAAAGSRSALYHVDYGLSGVNWGGRIVVPQPVADNQDYVVARSISATATDARGATSRKALRDRLADPVVNPADIYARGDAGARSNAVLQAAATDSARDKVSAVSLNPQPLPPGPDRDAHSMTQSKQEQAGIIIVSGTTATPAARKRRILLIANPAATPMAAPATTPVR